MLFKVVNSTNPQWNDIQLHVNTDTLEVGQYIEFFILHLKVTQWGGGVIVLSGKDDVITLQEVPTTDSEEPPVVTILDKPGYIRVHHEIDIFFEDKTIRLNTDDEVPSSALKEEFGLTYDALYRMLRSEWHIIAKAFPEHAEFIMEHEEGTNNYCFLRGWGFIEDKESDYTLLLKDGCWSKKSVDGRHI